MRPRIPHLTDTESVRAEAAGQYGELSDASALVQQWAAGIDPNVEATALKKVNVEETERLREELFEADGEDTVVHQKLADYLGDDHGIVKVLDVAVRGHALSVVGLTATGAPVKVVVPYTDKFESIGLSPAEQAERAHAMAEGSKVSLGAEMRAEVARQVAAATAEIEANLAKKYEAKAAEVDAIRNDALANAEGVEEAGATTTSRGLDGGTKAADDEGSEGSEDDSGFPRSHDELDKLAKKAKVEFASRDNIDEKIVKLKAAGVTPPSK